ncbi:MAG: hypothetical protein LC126_02770 [Bryobacterales bacterium]|nr:hypothetical protein [Bryobacterales bacterium]
MARRGGRIGRTAVFGFTAGDRRVLHEHFEPGRQGLATGRADRERRVH